MKYKVEYDDLTEEFDIKLDDKTWLSVSGQHRKKWANKISKMLNEKRPNKVNRPDVNCPNCEAIKKIDPDHCGKCIRQ